MSVNGAKIRWCEHDGTKIQVDLLLYMHGNSLVLSSCVGTGILHSLKYLVSEHLVRVTTSYQHSLTLGGKWFVVTTYQCSLTLKQWCYRNGGDYNSCRDPISAVFVVSPLNPLNGFDSHVCN